MTLIDTRTLIDFFHDQETPQTRLLDSQLGREQFVLGDLVHYELMRGFRRDSDLELAGSVLQPLQRQALVTEESVAAGIAHYRKLRACCDASPATTAMFLATHCLLHEQPLLFSDPAFAPMVTHLELYDRLTLDGS